MDDSSTKDKAGGMQSWLLRQGSSLASQIVGAVVTTATLSLGYVIFNDYVAPPPDLSGSWKFTVIYEDTARNEFQNLQVTYQILLHQEDLNLSGHGEKLSDRGPTQDAVDYTGDRRTNIELQGAITRSYFSPDTVQIQYSEEGRRRQSSTILRLVRCGREILCGCFRSTIAETSGSVWWQRRGDLDRIYEPVKRPDDCGDADCQDATGQCR